MNTNMSACGNNSTSRSSATSSVDVSIVIVNWNTRDVLRGCLRSIFEQTKDISFEVVVIDNASTDGSPDMVRTEFPSVILIDNTVNKGFAAANNQGLVRMAGRYALLLNPDTIILDGAIQRCVALADAEPDIGVLGCQVLEDEHTIQKTGFSFPSVWTLFLINSRLMRLMPRSRLLGKPELGWWDRRSDQDIDIISGMFMLVRREAIEQVGIMDEAYFVYGEEADWCYRFAKAGWRRHFTTAARIIHLDGGSKSTSQVSARMYVQLQKSMMIYARKHLGPLSALAVKGIYVAANAIRFAAWTAKAALRGDPVTRSRATAAGAALRFHLLGKSP